MALFSITETQRDQYRDEWAAHVGRCAEDKNLTLDEYIRIRRVCSACGAVYGKDWGSICANCSGAS